MRNKLAKQIRRQIRKDENYQNLVDTDMKKEYRRIVTPSGFDFLLPVTWREINSKRAYYKFVKKAVLKKRREW